MTQSQPRANDLLRRAIGKLVVGLEKRERALRERRRHQRYPFGVQVSLCLKNDDDSYQTLCEGWAVDLSIGGIGCLTTQELDRDIVLYVNFEEVLGRACYVPIKIMGSKTLFGGIQQIHAEFFFADESDGQQAQAA